MSIGADHTGNALKVHGFDPEPFSIFASEQLRAAPIVPPGICANPTCSKPFAPMREWQEYCSHACRKSAEAERAVVGRYVAPALLAWRAGKYERRDQALRELSGAGRNYLSVIASLWWASRKSRANQEVAKHEP